MIPHTSANLGSGSTLIAADQTGRVCRGLEFDPLYVDVIVRRYEGASGQAAVLAETGRASVSCRRGAREKRPRPGLMSAKSEPTMMWGLVRLGQTNRIS